MDGARVEAAFLLVLGASQLLAFAALRGLDKRVRRVAGFSRQPVLLAGLCAAGLASAASATLYGALGLASRHRGAAVAQAGLEMLAHVLGGASLLVVLHATLKAAEAAIAPSVKRPMYRRARAALAAVLLLWLAAASAACAAVAVDAHLQWMTWFQGAFDGLLAAVLAIAPCATSALLRAIDKHRKSLQTHGFMVTRDAVSEMRLRLQHTLLVVEAAGLVLVAFAAIELLFGWDESAALETPLPLRHRVRVWVLAAGQMVSLRLAFSASVFAARRECALTASAMQPSAQTLDLGALAGVRGPGGGLLWAVRVVPASDSRLAGAH